MVEQSIFEDEILKTLPNSWGRDYMMVYEEMSNLNTIEAQLVKAGDLLDRVFECMDEIVRGNKNPFEEIIIKDLERLFEMRLMSVNYFLKYSLKDINADEYLSDEVKESLEYMDFSPYF